MPPIPSENGKEREQTHSSQVDRRPALLVSYCFLEAFLNLHGQYGHRNWALDSGAFTAWTSGEPIDLQEYIDCSKALRDGVHPFYPLSEPGKVIDPPVEVYALDVIGDWRASLANVEEMWRQGVEAIPCFHVGEPWDVLIGLARDYPKIALGGSVGKNPHLKERWLGQCFARVWPKPIHGFGCAKEITALAFPWHSVDSSSWEKDAAGWGKWAAFSHLNKHGRRTYGKLSVRGREQPLSLEVQYFLDLEQRMQERWLREMEQLPEDYCFGIDGVRDAPTIRLVVGAGRSVRPDLVEQIFQPRKDH